MVYAKDCISNPKHRHWKPLTTRLTRDPQRETTEVTPQYLETVTIHDRDFQKYSIDHSVYLVPVDEVSEYQQPFVSTSSQSGRKRHIGLRLNTGYSTWYSTDDSFFHQ